MWQILDIHAWHMSDNTIQIWLIGTKVEKWVTFPIHPYYMNFTSYKMNAIDPTSLPHPRISWIAANNEEVIRFQCGPGPSCYPTIKDPVPIPTGGPKFFVKSIVNMKYNWEMDMLLVHPGGAIRVQESNTDLTVVSSLSWANQPWFNTYPTNELRGVVRTWAGRNNQLKSRLTLAISPTNVTSVGLIVSAIYEPNDSRQVRTVTLMPQSAQNLAAHEKNTGDGLVYYWLIQEAFAGVSAKNAFVLSHGGSAQDPLQHASTTFNPGVHWSSEVFLFDRSDDLVTLDVGMIASGNETQSLSPGPFGGYNIWTPQYAYGYGAPEVQLRSPKHMSSGMPILARNVFGEYQGSMASLASQHSDGCWYYVILDWNSNVAKQQAIDQLLKRSSETIEMIRNSPNHFADHAFPSSPAFRSTEDRDIENMSTPNSFTTANTIKTKKAVDTAATSAAHDFKRDFMFTPDCRATTCSIDEPGDCPIGKCWARGAVGGFQCCEHPPV